MYSMNAQVTVQLPLEGSVIETVVQTFHVESTHNVRKRDRIGVFAP